MTYPWLNNEQDQFLAQAGSERMAHACLLCGPGGLGKMELASQMAKVLLCKEGQKQSCGSCQSCRLFESGAHPDFYLLTFELNAKTGKMRSELIIDQVRRLNASMQLTHSISPRKVALIYPAESMNRNTSNALLKTLEEPQGDAVIILVSHQASLLPATIRSRCQSIHVRLPDSQMALNWLIEEHQMEPEDSRIALKASAGSPLMALEMLKDGSLEQFRSVINSLGKVQNEEAAVADVVKAWSALDQGNLWSWLSLIAANRMRRIFRLVDTTEAQRQLAKRVLKLQSLADSNRFQIGSGLRKELLLHDWLIQWSRLSG